MEIHVASRQMVNKRILEIHKDKPDARVLVISITDSKSDPVGLWVRSEDDVLRLSFHDLDKDYPGELPHIVLFTKDMAKEIRDFIFNQITCTTYLAEVARANLEKLIVIVHCEAGISRSAGVAAALAKRFNNDDTTYFSDASKYLPNRLVYKTLLDLLNGKDNPIPYIKVTNQPDIF